MKILIALAALSAGGALAVMAQETEAGPPPVLQIAREWIKEGKSAAHEKTEAAYARAFRKADFPGHYLALSPLSGPNEIWFIEAFPSFETAEKWQVESEREPLKSALEEADAQDGALRERSDSLWAVYHPHLSYHAEKLDEGMTRFMRVFTYRIQPGHMDEFVAEVAAVTRAYERANADRIFVGYEVKAGAPAGTYLFMESLTSLQLLDSADETSHAYASAVGVEGLKKLDEFDAGVASMEVNLYRVNPRMSYVSKTTEDEDPAFWRQRPPAVKPAPAAKNGN